MMKLVTSRVNDTESDSDHRWIRTHVGVVTAAVLLVSGGSEEELPVSCCDDQKPF